MPLLAWLRRHYPALERPPYARLLWATALSSLGSQFTVLALSVAVFSATGLVASLAGIWACGWPRGSCTSPSPAPWPTAGIGAKPWWAATS